VHRIPQALVDEEGVLLGDLAVGRGALQGVAHPVSERAPLLRGQGHEEVRHERGKSAPAEQGRGLVRPERPGGAAGHQPFHHRLMDEAEAAFLVAHEERARAELVGGHGRVQIRHVEPGNEKRCLLVQISGPHARLRLLPEPQGELRDALPESGRRQGREPAARRDTFVLVPQPPIDEHPVERGGGDLASLLPGLPEMNLL
jgi:hypothetical protein